MALLVGVLVLWLIVMTTTRPDTLPRCVEVGTEASPAPLVDYRDGTWYGPDGSPVGYAATEDSAIWNRPDCP